MTTKRHPARTLWHGGLVAVAGLVALGGAAGALPTTSAAATRPSALSPGQQLAVGRQLASPDGSFRLAMQSDGNLVEYRATHVLFSTRTGGHPGARLVMQRNGDLVLYSAANRPLWSSATAGHAGAFLVLANSGTLELYSRGRGRLLWSSVKPLPLLSYGDRGSAVTALQRRLTALGYWTGPADGYFGDATRQALYALEKVAGIARTGTLDPATRQALARGEQVRARPAAGNLVEVDLEQDLVLIIRHGHLAWVLNTSTGGGYTYTSQGVTSVAITPKGVYHVYGQIDGVDVAPLGTLWRPKFFTDGDAIHGDSYVPPYPVSHGCVRVSIEAINWIWANNFIPLGSKVWVY